MKLGWSEVLTSVVTLDNQVHYFYPALRVESSFWFSYSLFNWNVLQQFSELRNMIKFLNEQCETAEKQEN